MLFLCSNVRELLLFQLKVKFESSIKLNVAAVHALLIHYVYCHMLVTLKLQLTQTLRISI